MTIYQFNAADEMEQIEAIWNAKDIEQYEDEVYLYKCYQLNDFYIETKKHKEHGVLHGIRIFRNRDLLEPYLDKMDL